MREIRFRAWNKTTEEMENHDAMFKTSCYYQNPFDRCDFILMQFTGLHDRNGKEIWEGDIVIIDGGLKWVCRWSDNHARFYFDTGLHKTDDFSAQESKNFEVIGNIYALR